ncbi:hypothetical protein LTR94_025804, partial [Friedmanniomyces endolithicus]
MAAAALKGLRAPRPKPERRLRRVGDRLPARATQARSTALEALGDQLMTSADLSRASGVSSSVIKGLVDEGVIETVEIAFEAAFPAPDPDHAPARLNPDQDAAAQALADGVSERDFRPFLLDGVTGSGKTEAYLEAVARALRQDPAAQILILLPEIALTQALIERIAARFGA